MASIADVFLKLALDMKSLEMDAQKAGDKAGETVGSRMSKGISTAMRVGLTVIAGAAAIATKGMVELDDITAQFTADTGASADEADRAKKAILEMSGRNLQPMREIGATLGKVHTDLNLVGDEAEATAEDFLQFARVTKRDASEEVSAFDDILDAWGLTADKSRGIMDKLIVSHQEYGGAIADDETALASMAPQLKAFNLTIDDGIGLLNLFKSSGLEASQIPRALNSAIQKLDGRPLSDFIAELASIEDPTKRAQRAIEIFGSRAGVQLANAIKPGMTSLEDFKITTEDASGALDDARDAIDGTFSNRVQLAIKGVTEKIIEFGSAFGPALTGLASLASLGGALGLDKLAGPLIKKLFELGKESGQALIDGIGTATGAAGTIIGNFFASRIESILDPTKPTLIGRAIRSVGAKAAVVYGVAFAAGSKLAAALATVIAAMPGVGMLRSAILASAIKLGTLQGTAMGTAAGLAFRVALLAGVVLAAEEVKKHLDRTAQDINDSTWGQLGIDFNLNPEEWPWPLGPKGAPDWAGGSVDTGVDNAAFIPEKIAAELRGGTPAVTNAAGAMAGTIPTALRQSVDEAGRHARRIPGLLANELRDKRTAWQRAWDQLKEDAKNSMSTMEEIAKIRGKLIKIAASKGWASGDLIWIASLKDTRQILEARLAELEPLAEKKGEKANKGLADGIKRGNAPGRAADAVADRIKDQWSDIPSYNWGSKLARLFAQGINSQAYRVRNAIGSITQGIAGHLEFGSPTKEGPFSRGGGPEGWAKVGARDWVKGWTEVDPVPAIRRLAAQASAALAAGAGSPSVAFAGALPGTGIPSMGGISGTVAGGVTIGDIYVDARGATNPQAVGHAVRQAVMDATAEGLRGQTARLPVGTRA